MGEAGAPAFKDADALEFLGLPASHTEAELRRFLIGLSNDLQNDVESLGSVNTSPLRIAVDPACNGAVKHFA